MTSTRPYLIRAFYEWIVDNKCTPYIMINTEKQGIEVPRQYVEDGKIVLNISAMAVRDLSISNHMIEFNAKFGGVPMHVYAPISAIIAVYAHENGRGMVFSEDEEDDGEPPHPEPQTSINNKKGKPKLTLVKS